MHLERETAHDRRTNRHFQSLDPLYPPGLDENNAGENMHPAFWICSKSVLLQGIKFTTAVYKFCTLHELKFTQIDAVYKF